MIKKTFVCLFVLKFSMANAGDQVQEINQKLEQLTEEQLKIFIANFLVRYKSEVEASQEEALNLLEKCESCGAMVSSVTNNDEYETLWQVLREVR